MGYEVSKMQSQFEELKSIIIFHKNKAYQAVNTEIITTSWEVGKFISYKIKSEQWGAGVVNQFVKYLKNTQPDLRGFDRNGIYRMMRFYDAYSSVEFVSSVMTQLEDERKVVKEYYDDVLTSLEDDSSVEE